MTLVMRPKDPWGMSVITLMFNIHFRLLLSLTTLLRSRLWLHLQNNHVNELIYQACQIKSWLETKFINESNSSSRWEIFPHFFVTFALIFETHLIFIFFTAHHHLEEEGLHHLHNRDSSLISLSDSHDSPEITSFLLISWASSLLFTMWYHPPSHPLCIHSSLSITRMVYIKNLIKILSGKEGKESHLRSPSLESQTLARVLFSHQNKGRKTSLCVSNFNFFLLMIYFFSCILRQIPHSFFNLAQNFGQNRLELTRWGSRVVFFSYFLQWREALQETCSTFFLRRRERLLKWNWILRSFSLMNIAWRWKSSNYFSSVNSRGRGC